MRASASEICRPVSLLPRSRKGKSIYPTRFSCQPPKQQNPAPDDNNRVAHEFHHPAIMEIEVKAKPVYKWAVPVYDASNPFRNKYLPVTHCI